MKRQGYGRIGRVSMVVSRNVSRLSGPRESSATTGMLGLTRHLAQGLPLFGIAVSAAAAGSPLMGCVAKKWALRPKDDRGRTPANIPLGRLGQAEDVATVIAFLASDNARYVTGVTIGVKRGSFRA